MLNKVFLQGRLTADPELKATQSGVSVVSFSLASDRDYLVDGNRPTDFINCVAWRKTAEFIAAHFKKGNPMLVVGRLEIETYKAQDGSKRYTTNVNVSEVQFIGGKQNEAENAKNEPSPQFEEVAKDDDLPF